MTGRRLAVAGMVGAILFMHSLVAVRRSARLLEHDEAVSLLIASGKGFGLDRVYEGFAEGEVQAIPAGVLQDLMRPTGGTRISDVVRSGAGRDIHPPLYFAALHVAQRLGIGAHAMLRLAGSALVLVAGWIAWRWIWPEASFIGKVLGLAMVAAAPAMIGVATELRQYAFVFLGTVVSFAAIVTYWDGRRSVWGATVLMCVGPVLLIWSQFGTAVWVAVAFAAAVAGTVYGPVRRRKILAWSVPIGLVMIVPLAMWQAHGISVASRPPSVGLSISGWAVSLRDVLCGAAQAWCSVPGRWQGLPAWLFVAAAALGASVISILARREGAVCVRSAAARALPFGSRLNEGSRARGVEVDRVLLYAAVAWAVAWAMCLACGKIPPHGAQTKYLAPLVLCPVVLLVRATAAAHPAWVRRGATALLAGAMVSHAAVGARQMLASLSPQPSVAALGSARCLLVDETKRGYVLPLAAKMDARGLVVIAEPDGISGWCAAPLGRLPEEGLVLAEIGGTPGGRHKPGSQALYDLLSQAYREALLLREGPRRTITQFRYRLAMPLADGEDLDG